MTRREWARLCLQDLGCPDDMLAVHLDRMGIGDEPWATPDDSDSGGMLRHDERAEIRDLTEAYLANLRHSQRRHHNPEILASELDETNIARIVDAIERADVDLARAAFLIRHSANNTTHAEVKRILPEYLTTVKVTHDAPPPRGGASAGTCLNYTSAPPSWDTWERLPGVRSVRDSCPHNGPILAACVVRGAWLYLDHIRTTAQQGAVSLRYTIPVYDAARSPYPFKPSARGWFFDRQRLGLSLFGIRYFNTRDGSEGRAMEYVQHQIEKQTTAAMIATLTQWDAR